MIAENNKLPEKPAQKKISKSKKRLKKRIFTILVLLGLYMIFIWIQGSLQQNKKRAQDAAIKANAAALRSEMELYASANEGSYLSGCSSVAAENTQQRIKNYFFDAITYCKDSNSRWVFYTSLNNGEYFCVDSTGFAGTKKALADSDRCY